MFTNVCFITEHSTIAVFGGNTLDLKGKDSAFLVYTDQKGEEKWYVAFSSSDGRKVFLLEHKGGETIPSQCYTGYRIEHKINIIDTRLFKRVRQLRGNVFDTGVRALSPEEVSETHLVSVGKVLTSMKEGGAKHHVKARKEGTDVLPHRVEGKEPKRFDPAPEENPWAAGQAKNARQAKRNERIAYLQKMLAKAEQDQREAKAELAFKQQEEMLMKRLADLGIDVSSETKSA